MKIFKKSDLIAGKFVTSEVKAIYDKITAI